MLTERATVIEIKDNTLWLQTQIKTTCGSCAQKDNCGTSAVAKAFSPKPNVIGVPYDAAKFSPVSVGDKALIGVQEGFVVKSALYVYLLPIVGFLLLALLADGLLKGDIITLTGVGAEAFSALLAFTGGFMGYGVARRLVAKMSGDVVNGQAAQADVDTRIGCDTNQKVHVLQIDPAGEN